MSVEEDTEIEVWYIKEGWHVLSWREVLEDKRKYFQEEFCVVRYYNAQLRRYRCCYLNFEGVNHFKKDFWRWCNLFADGFAGVLDYDGGVWYYIDYLGNVFDGKEVQEYWKKYGGFGSDELKKHLEEKLKLAQKKEEE